MKAVVLGAAAGFLAGSIPFGLLLARAAGRTDPRLVGSGNVGATNVARTGGLHLGLLTLLLDAAKGALPSAFVLHHHGAVPAAATGFAAVLGHCFSPWLRLRGGKGVATLLGVVGALAWPWGLLTFAAVWIVLMATLRWASVASLAAAGLMPVAVWLSGGPPVFIAVFAATTLVVLFQHRGNIRRLAAGTEPRFGGRPKEAGS